MEKTANEIVVQHLAELRKKHGLPQLVLSDELYGDTEMEGSVVGRIERRLRTVTAVDLLRYAEFFQEPLIDLFVDLRANTNFEGRVFS